MEVRLFLKFIKVGHVLSPSRPAVCYLFVLLKCNTNLLLVRYFLTDRNFFFLDPPSQKTQNLEFPKNRVQTRPHFTEFGVKRPTTQVGPPPAGQNSLTHSYATAFREVFRQVRMVPTLNIQRQGTFEAFTTLPIGPLREALSLWWQDFL